MLAAAETAFDGQDVQTEGPNSVVYVSTSHGEQKLAFGPAYPGLHRHEVFIMLAAVEVEFNGQAMQMADPIPAWYVPAKHAVHVFPFAPVYPGLH